MQDEPVTRLRAVLEHLPDLSQVTIVAHSTSNSSHSSFHADILDQLLQLIDGMLQQFACAVTQRPFTVSVLFNWPVSK